MKLMKRLSGTALLVCAGLALAIQPATAGKGRGGGGKGGGGQVVPATLSVDEAATLTFMREEEKLARDVYLYLFDLWGTQVFANIANSEQSHMDALKSMLDKYGLPDPVLDPGEFSDPHLQELYDTLVFDGSLSLLDALKVGGLIEEVDIEDLVVAMIETDKTDLDRVYGNLMRGSERHLRSFAGLIESITGQPYEAQFLSQEEVDGILAGS